MIEPLFDLEPEPGEDQECQVCGWSTVATVDQLRTKGWAAYDGVSLTDKTLTVRICPRCKEEPL